MSIAGSENETRRTNSAETSCRNINAVPGRLMPTPETIGTAALPPQEAEREEAFPSSRGEVRISPDHENPNVKDGEGEGLERELGKVKGRKDDKVSMGQKGNEGILYVRRRKKLDATDGGENKKSSKAGGEGAAAEREKSREWDAQRSKKREWDAVLLKKVYSKRGNKKEDKGKAAGHAAHARFGGGADVAHHHGVPSGGGQDGADGQPSGHGGSDAEKGPKGETGAQNSEASVPGRGTDPEQKKEGSEEQTSMQRAPEPDEGTAQKTGEEGRLSMPNQHNDAQVTPSSKKVQVPKIKRLTALRSSLPYEEFLVNLMPKSARTLGSGIRASLESTLDVYARDTRDHVPHHTPRRTGTQWNSSYVIANKLRTQKSNVMDMASKVVNLKSIQDMGVELEPSVIGASTERSDRVKKGRHDVLMRSPHDKLGDRVKKGRHDVLMRSPYDKLGGNGKKGFVLDAPTRRGEQEDGEEHGEELDGAERRDARVVILVEWAQRGGGAKNPWAEPFCLVNVGGRTMRTRCVESSLSPVWMHRFIFSVDNRDQFISVSLCERFGHSLDSVMGTAAIPVRLIRKGAAQPDAAAGFFEEWFDLFKSRSGQPTGRLLVSCHYLPKGAHIPEGGPDALHTSAFGGSPRRRGKAKSPSAQGRSEETQLDISSSQLDISSSQLDISSSELDVSASLLEVTSSRRGSVMQRLSQGGGAPPPAWQTEAETDDVVERLPSDGSVIDQEPLKRVPSDGSVLDGVPADGSFKDHDPLKRVPSDESVLDEVLTTLPEGPRGFTQDGSKEGGDGFDVHTQEQTSHAQEQSSPAAAAHGGSAAESDSHDQAVSHGQEAADEGHMPEGSEGAQKHSSDRQSEAEGRTPELNNTDAELNGADAEGNSSGAAPEARQGKEPQPPPKTKSWSQRLFGAGK